MNPAFFARVLTLALAAWGATVSAQQTPLHAPPRPFDFLGANVTILLSGADTGGTSTTMKIQIPAHAGPPPHIHTREDEVFIITSGTFQFFMDGVCLQAGPGTSVFMPKGHTHTFKNISKHAGEQLVVVYPAGLEQFFLDVHELGLKMPEDFAKLNELSNSKYGMNHLPGHDFKAGDCKKVPRS
jgi:mannose-6-phosphate isomerase-like protein (cupin superfamily)